MQKINRIASYIFKRIGVAGVLLFALSLWDRDVKSAKIGFLMAIAAGIMLPVLAIEKHLWVSGVADELATERISLLQNPSQDQIKLIHQESAMKAKAMWIAAANG